jgi:rod shape-determining protein MreC
MLDTQLRQRPLMLLVAVVLAQVLLLAFQIKREHDVPLLRYWAAELVTPVGRIGSWTSSKIRGTWNGYVALHGAHAENERLRAELDQLRLRTRDLESQAAEAQRLRVLLDFRQAHSDTPMLAAQVIGASADPTSHILFINRGERDHLRRNMAVITPDGIVGKVVEVFANNTAQVLLINDKESGVGVLFADTRTHGVVKGTGDPEPLMDYVSNDEKVHAGQIVVTSGEDRIFPKDLPVGVVDEAKQGNTFQVIRVRPAVRLDRLEDVLILLSRQDATLKAIQESPEEPASQPAVPAASVQSPADAPKPSAAASAPATPPAPEQ